MPVLYPFRDGILHVRQAGDVRLVPAVHEGVGVDGHDLGVVVKHGADLVGVHLRGHHGGVDIAADLLGDPFLCNGSGPGNRRLLYDGLRSEN